MRVESGMDGIAISQRLGRPRTRPKKLAADRGYSIPRVRDWLRARGMMPPSFLPSFMQTVSHFSPVKWGILALEGAIWRGFSPSEMFLPCGVLLGMGTVCFGLGVTVLARKDG